ncbi:hypothetical protein BGX38DRAFT_1146016 [Terfezia claveryi]|nr:hypothetical protein BGX38DRAFT_1146016 [Terfezia claveryi]
MSASNVASATPPVHAASPGDFAEEVIFEPSDTPTAFSPLESTLDLEPSLTLLEPNYAAFCTSRNRAERTSASSQTSSGGDSTNFNSPDSDSDAASEPDSLFDRNTEAGTTISEVQTWGSESTDSGDHSANSIPSLSAYSEVGDGDMGSHHIPNLNDLAASRNVGHDPAPGTQSHLPCPFRWDGCEVRFDIAEKKKWIYHSLDHFHENDVRPPAHLICPYGDCSERFVNENRIGNWNNRMEHYAQHVKERLEQLRESRGWAEDDDLDVEGLGILNMPEKVDINFQQYMIHHGANKIGLDILINPKPRSELDNIPRGYMNRMHPAYGGPRFREVVYPPFDYPFEKNLDSRSAGAMFVRDSRRTGEAGKVLTARTSGEPFKPKLPRQYSLGGRREACERIIQK